MTGRVIWRGLIVWRDRACDTVCIRDWACVTGRAFVTRGVTWRAHSRSQGLRNGFISTISTPCDRACPHHVTAPRTRSHAESQMHAASRPMSQCTPGHTPRHSAHRVASQATPPHRASRGLAPPAPTPRTSTSLPTSNTPGHTPGRAPHLPHPAPPSHAPRRSPSCMRYAVPYDCPVDCPVNPRAHPPA